MNQAPIRTNHRPSLYCLGGNSYQQPGAIMLFRSLSLAAIFTLPMAALGENRVLDVVTSEYPPYEYSSDGQVVGEDTRIIRRVLSKTEPPKSSSGQ